MKRLDKRQLDARDELLKRLREAAIKIEETVNATNAAITAYNEVVGDVEAYRDGLVEAMEAYYDERSETWQAGDAGQNYESWKGDFEGLDVVTIDELEVPDAESLAAELEGLAEDPGTV